MGSVQHLHLVDLSDEDVEPTAVIAAAAQGDLAAFEALYRRFAPRLYGLCLRLTGQREAAEDCVQESFVAAWRGLGRFEKRSRFATWLQRIAIRTVIARRRGLRNAHEVGEPATGLPDRPDPDGGAPPLDLERAIAALPEGARDVLVWWASMATATRRRRMCWAWRKVPARLNCIAHRGLLSAALGLEES